LNHKGTKTQSFTTMKELLLAYYGDDFTGSTDALEFLCRAGAKTVLFIEPPTAEQLQLFPEIDAYGVAGKTRSLSPIEMEEVLVDGFIKMKGTNAKHIHYKVCSTFDSSSTVGSIGKVVDIASSIFNNKLIPVIGGTPSLGRYCVFGNLFAQMGIGSNGAIYRLDRHPSMSKHPVTPANESDLRLHLQQQTTNKIGLIDILQLEQPIDQWTSHLQDDEKVVLVDALYNHQLTKIGEWLDAQFTGGRSVFSIGGSSVEVALGNYWNSKNIVQSVNQWPHHGKASPLLVISGSCSPVTAAQIAWAKANGFAEVIIDTASVCEQGLVEVALVEQTTTLLQNGTSVIVHTGAKGDSNLPSEKIGTALGILAKYVVKKTGIKRVVVAGGDTSSYAARAMNIDAVEMIAPLVKGAPLCKVHSKDVTMHGLEINFKGGQVGGDNYFGLLLNGEI
jgi:uncharacterized protein YgbK (DUF1537 family)